jgi:hypothetical protein
LKSVTLREKYRLRMFVGRMLWKVFMYEREEVTGGWRKAHIVELCDFCCVRNVTCLFGGIREVELDRACGICGG